MLLISTMNGDRGSYADYLPDMDLRGMRAKDYLHNLFVPRPLQTDAKDGEDGCELFASSLFR